MRLVHFSVRFSYQNVHICSIQLFIILLSHVLDIPHRSRGLARLQSKAKSPAFVSSQKFSIQNFVFVYTTYSYWSIKIMGNRTGQDNFVPCGYEGPVFTWSGPWSRNRVRNWMVDQIFPDLTGRLVDRRTTHVCSKILFFECSNSMVANIHWSYLKHVSD